MAECGRGAKRKEGEHSEVCSADDVAEWFARQVDSGGCGKVGEEHRSKILQALGEQEVEREVLAKLDRQRQKIQRYSTLPIVKEIRQRSARKMPISSSAPSTSQHFAPTTSTSSRSPLLAAKQEGGCPPPKANRNPARHAIVS